MIHSGSASGGHYYAYIKDFISQQWFDALRIIFLFLFIYFASEHERTKKKKNHDLFLLVHIYLGSASTTRAFLVSHTMTFAGLTEGDHLVVPVISLVPIPLVRMPTCLCIERYACFHLFSLKQVIHVAAP